MKRRYKLDYEIIAKNIKIGRKAIGITQNELSQRIHLTTNQVAKLETNKTTASIETIINIANSLNVSLDFLLCEEVEGQQDSIDILINSQLKDFTHKEKEALLLVMNAMRICKEN